MRDPKKAQTILNTDSDIFKQSFSKLMYPYYITLVEVTAVHIMYIGTRIKHLFG